VSNIRRISFQLIDKYCITKIKWNKCDVKWLSIAWKCSHSSKVALFASLSVC
jgi:hypothetical protein